MTPPLLEAVPERLATARLVLRPATAADAAAWHGAAVEAIEALRPFVPWAARGAPSPAQCEGDCRRMQAQFLMREHLTWLLFERDPRDGGDAEGGLLGAAGLYRIDWQVRRFEIGYWIRTRRAGEGLALEAVQALTRCAFETLRAMRVEARIDDTNERSWRLAERAGYRLEGVLRRESLAPDGAPRDLRIYALTNLPGEAGPAGGVGSIGS